MMKALAPAKQEAMPEKLVRWRTVSVDWRHALEAIPLASSYRSLNLTPNTLHSSPLANADGTLTLFQGVSSNGTPRLFYSLDQINRAKDGMRLRGVTSQEIRSSWDKSWEWKSDKVGELTRITFNNTEELRSRMADLKAKGVLREQTPAPKTEGSSAMASPAPPAHTGSGAPVDSAVSAFKKRLLASDAQLPTPSPSPSVESSPEPSSSSAPALKKLKPTLTQAQEEAKAIREAANLARYSEEFKLVRAEWLRAKKEGGAAFLSIDVEMWERSKDCLLEFGWSLVDFVKGKKGKVEERRETRHVIVSEHLKRRNGRFSPDARDHFDFGTSLTLPSATIFSLLHATFETLSSDPNSQLFLIFHDPRADIKALQTLGFEEGSFERSLAGLAAEGKGKMGQALSREGGVIVCDTQTLYSAWAGVPYQTGLSKCCEALEVPTKRLHNAGNDAHYTQVLFERMMDPTRERPATL